MGARYYVCLAPKRYRRRIYRQNDTPKFGIQVKSASGGILSGIELRGVSYERLFSASEIRFRPNLGDILLDGELSLSSVDIKDLKLNEAELKKSSTPTDPKTGFSKDRQNREYIGHHYRG